MGSLFRRKRPLPKESEKDYNTVNNDPTVVFHDSDSESLNAKAQDVMKDNLELMKEVILHLRQDDVFASSIYSDCPRLQHLLREHPDLRPVFEDPRLVRLNFEQVYKNAGGVLPEDETERTRRRRRCYNRCRKFISRIVNHPLFKILRFFLLIKKIITCLAGTGMMLVRGAFDSMCGHWCWDDPSDLLDADNADLDTGNPDNRANRIALRQAATHMEDPDVQERVADVLAEDDPEALQDMIDQDKDLRALRDSNALCAELMKDPDTMRILTDPENLRALAECPDLIEQDFADPNWTAPDIENNMESGDLVEENNNSAENLNDSINAGVDRYYEQLQEGATEGESEAILADLELGESQLDQQEQQASYLEDFELGDSAPDLTQSDMASSYTNMATTTTTTGVEDSAVLDGLELGESNVPDDSVFLQDMELGEVDEANEMHVSDAAMNGSSAIYENMDLSNPNVAVTETNASVLEGLELGDADFDGQEDAGIGSSIEDLELGDADNEASGIEDLELGDADNEASGIEDLELGDADNEASGIEDLELGEADNDDNVKNAAQTGSSGAEFQAGDVHATTGPKAVNQKSRQTLEEGESSEPGNSRFRGFMSSLGAGVTDYLAAELVGFSMAEIWEDDALGALEEVDDMAGDTFTDQIADTAEVVVNDDVADNMEDGMDDLKESHDNSKEASTRAIGEHSSSNLAATSAGGAVIASGGTGNASRSTGDTATADDQSTTTDISNPIDTTTGDQPVKKRNRFRMVGNVARAISTATKEHVASLFLGDDFGEMLVEKIEEKSEDSDDDNDSKKSGRNANHDDEDIIYEDSEDETTDNANNSNKNKSQRSFSK